MIDPTTGLTLGGVVTAVVAGVAGFVAHELAHIGVLTLFGRRPTIELGFEHLVFAAVPPAGTPRWQLATALLAPVGVAALGVWGLFGPGGVLSVPLTLDGVLVLAAFLIAALPSPADVYVLLMYDPAANTQGVATNG